ncbi:uncharacterized tatC-like protein ymf16 [Euphorbia lathyris]|uniref:uncharacterized tatC-like protein ymf16 n=1 Tax=Euphorbia lathyris TaxID=212925 RepID=UPI003313246F
MVTLWQNCARSSAQGGYVAHQLAHFLRKRSYLAQAGYEITRKDSVSKARKGLRKGLESKNASKKGLGGGLRGIFSSFNFLFFFPLNYSYISYEFHFAPETILGEVRIRSVRILIGLGLTWFTRYWFPEELIFPLAKPFITLPLDSYFVCTQSTEASPTYVATSSIACSYFVFPLISHQIWCFLIPSCYGEQRTKYNRFFHLSGSRFSLFLFLTPPRVVPNVWHFPYFVGATSTNSLMIKLQPKIYDYIMLTVRISFIPSVCSQVPVIVIRLPEPRGLSVETSTNNRRFLMVFPLLTAALFTPPDIWCQIVARFLISLIIELAIFVASIVQVREEGWTSGMRESGSIDKKEE